MTYIKTPVNPGLFIILYGRGNHDGDYFDWINLEPLDESQYNIVQSTKDWRI